MTTGTHRDLIRALLAARSTVLADVQPDDPGASDPRRLLVRSDVSGTMQLAELAGEGPPTTLTALPEPVGGAHYVPGARRAILEIDAGGNERGQLFLLDLDRAAPATAFDELAPLTPDPQHGHHFAGISPDGRRLAYTSDRETGVDFDVYECDLETGEHRMLWRSHGWAMPASGFSPDGRHLAVQLPGDRPLDLAVVVIDTVTPDVVTVHATPGRASLFDAPAWLGPDRYLLSTDAGGDLSALAVHAVADPADRLTPIAGSGERYDTGVVTSRDGHTALAIENRDGASALRVIDLDAGALADELALPETGVVAPMLSPDGATLYYTLTGPRIPGDVFALDLAGGETRRLTHSPCEITADELAVPQLASVESVDGETIPYLVYRPRNDPAGGRPPVVVHVHGGPEAQAQRIFNPIIQALVAAGYAVVVPNVRGSTGYGRRYASLDDTTRRLDSVRDLASVHGALDGLGLDRARAALWGGSYGGYMVLAGLALQPQLWAAGVEIVGISNLVTFLQNTSAYRRAHREREYGSLEHDHAFLVQASPLTHIEAMRAPLFVIHGRNDPRVPVSEAEQLAAGLAQRGVRCELAIYDDEGHGLARLPNRLDAFPRAIDFLDETLQI